MMTPHRLQARRGFGLALGIACVTVLALIAGSLAAISAREHLTLKRETLRAQAVWLAESGIELAAARLARDWRYSGETWTVPAEILNGFDGAVVTIAVENPDGVTGRRLVRVQARYPSNSATTHRVSKSIHVDRNALTTQGEMP